MFQAITFSQVLIEAKWPSSTNDLTQLEAETAMMMALLDLPATDLGKRKTDTNQNNQQPKRSKPEDNGRAGVVLIETRVHFCNNVMCSTQFG